MNDRVLYLSSIDFHDLIKALFKKESACTIKTVCKGFSMSPFIKDSDSIVISPVDEKNPTQVGNIVVLLAQEKGKKILVHRIIQVKNDFILLKGDNLQNPDGWFRKNLIAGVVHEIFRKNKKIRYPDSINFLIAVCSKTGILYFLLKTFRKIRQRVYAGI